MLGRLRLTSDLGLFLGGPGVFFVGIGVLDGVSAWDKK
jgi:hypothetical protein